MKISIIKRPAAALLAAILLLFCQPAAAYADEISDLRAEKDKLSNQVQECRERLQALKDQQANVLEQKAALSEQKRLSEEQLKLIAKQIDEYDELIEQKAEEVQQAKNREDAQLERYRSRVRAMEENGGYNLLAILFRSGDISQLMTAMEDMGGIMNSDRKLQDEYIAAREETEKIMAQYEEEKYRYEAGKAELELEREETNKQIEEAEDLLDELADDIAQAIAEYEAAEAAEQAAAASIAAAIAQYNAQQAANQAQANGNVSGTQGESGSGTNTGGTASGGDSGYTWPVPCSSRVTSRFGTRSDPFTGATATHYGIDIDGFGNDGAPVIAAAGGTVVTATYDGAYGNYVIINHGGSSTVYAHLSGLAVSAGANVIQGQTICYLGATGRATGTHLHFEVYVGDSRVDPTQYFSGLTYYNC